MFSIVFFDRFFAVEFSNRNVLQSKIQKNRTN